MSWTLESAEARAKAAPDTFLIPCLEVRERLVPGDLAKLIFVQHIPPAGERMWVRVDKTTGNGEYSGTLLNQPVTMEFPKVGHEVFFSAKHVADVKRTSGDGRGDLALI